MVFGPHCKNAAFVNSPTWKVRFAPYRRLGQTIVAVATVLSAVPNVVHADQPAAVSEESAERRQYVAELIEKLGSDNFFERENAQAKLAELGFEPFEALSEAENDPDLEVSSRAHYLVQSMQIEWTAEHDPPEVKAQLKGYDHLNESERLTRIRQLAALPEDAGLPALVRLVRFEKSHRLSKLSAIAILEMDVADDADQSRRARVIDETLQHSRRAAAGWLRTYTLALTDPVAALDRWSKLTAEEEAVLQAYATQSSGEIVSGLLRYQAQLLNRLERRDEALAVMERLLSFEQGEDPESLARLARWLADHDAWDVVDKLSERFADELAENPLVIYSLAEARQARNDESEVERWLSMALSLNPEDAQKHLAVGDQLRQQGSYNWSIREFRKVIEIAPALSNESMFACSMLSEVLHDQGHDRKAAETLAAAIAAVDEIEKQQTRLSENAKRAWAQRRDHLRARMEYFSACEAAAQGKPDDHAKHLDAALEADPTDADILIAQYRLTGQTEERKNEIRKRISELAGRYLSAIRQSPNEASYYNQFAWLVGNTEGDYDLAVRMSHKSLELKPDYAGFLDTLGRCYYAKGDLENAVKYQRRAVAGDPNSGLIRKQLELFEQALAKAKAEKSASP